MSKTVISPGLKIERWTVLDQYTYTAKGEKKWLCRCRCGTERYVLERSLLSGGSRSCGCLRKEAAREAVAHDLTGQRFGSLTVLEPVKPKTKNSGIWWKCRCDCGELCQFPGTLLMMGRRTHCSGKAHGKNYAYVDITGQRFGRLVALYRTPDQNAKGSCIWHCRCDCGNEVDVPYNNMVYANQISCGCRKKEHDQELKKSLVHMDGTSLEMLGSKKIPKNNTTGVKGVYLIRGKYVAKIVFQKKAYYLGTYQDLTAAIAARKEAEEAIFATALNFYDTWRKLADNDPEWAINHPANVCVKRNQDGRLYLEMSPKILQAEKVLLQKQISQFQ